MESDRLADGVAALGDASDRNTTGAEVILGARGERAACHHSPRLWALHTAGVRRARQPNAVAVDPLRSYGDPDIRALRASRRYSRRLFRGEGHSDRCCESHGQPGE